MPQMKPSLWVVISIMTSLSLMSMKTMLFFNPLAIPQGSKTFKKPTKVKKKW